MKKTVDGNMAVSLMMHKITEFASIYPITPSSPMAENYEKWTSEGKQNIFGKIPKCVEMQSEAGVAGALHGALLGGAVSTTFTSSQGLLLMIPNMYKIAGELLPCVINVAARSLATHALNIFGDHSDVMACRETGFAMLCASSVQECYDFSLLSLIASFNSSVPYLHFFDGFRTSHEIQKIELIDDAIINQLLPFDKINEFKEKALNPNKPVAKGTNQNPDVFFQNREACSINYQNVAKDLKNAMDNFYKLTNRKYNLFDYVGSEEAEYVIVAMGSGAENIEEYILKNNFNNIGLIKIRLFRPFGISTFVEKLPKTTKKICVLDRVKDTTGNVDPLCSEVINAVFESGKQIEVICGRYGLGGKDFTLGMIKSVCDNLMLPQSKNHFLLGVEDDVLNSSLAYNEIKEKEHYSALFYGLGSDGTVSANKNTIKIIGDNTEKFVQGYFKYDSKKSGSMTISHLRIGDEEIKSHYLINDANLIAVHNFNFLQKIKIKDRIKQNGKLLINSPYNVDITVQKFSCELLETITNKDLQVYVINANENAHNLGLKNKINVIMQAGFFKISGVIDENLAREQMCDAIKLTYGSKGEQIVKSNISAVEVGFNDLTLISRDLIEKQIKQCERKENENCIEGTDNVYCKNFILPILNGDGDKLKISQFDKSGTIKTGTTKYEKRKIAEKLPKWIPENCIQCNMCAISCPHACIKPKLMDKEIQNAPSDFKSIPFNRDKELNYKMQIKPADCTGCGVCANVCPAKNKALEMVNANEIFDAEIQNDKFVDSLPVLKNNLNKFTIAGSQFEPTMFEFNGACAGCGETPYIKLLTQLFGDKLIIANATGCSSIYGASCPTCPYTTNEKGQGPVFANSLFEDNAEFGLGIYYANRLNNKDDAIWIIGGDGWAYDIGFGGLDHILASGENINILVLDTEVYSNTGGQMSKSTPRGSAVKFASKGKSNAKKRLSSIALSYGNVYVAQISLGANMQQAINAFKEAQEYQGVSIIIAYCPCINHGIDMSKSSEEMKNAVQSGYFDLFRYNPDNSNPLSIDSKPIKDYEDFVNGENRYNLLKRVDANLSEQEIKLAKRDSERFRIFLKHIQEVSKEEKE
ncbi:MAG: pyruvate:ferredoxin (flavodoxin) oxidoreductase [Clostridia bacterium]|nr:pyruvate:ferredoxin (flavodoxin) oxidoreductase [Clostridia bacterium]